MCSCPVAKCISYVEKTTSEQQCIMTSVGSYREGRVPSRQHSGSFLIWGRSHQWPEASPSQTDLSDRVTRE